MAVNPNMAGGVSMGETRNREVVPGVFIPFPDSDESVKQDAEEQLRQAARADSQEPDKDCEAALKEGLNQETLNDYKGIRQWVMCTAWRKSRDNSVTFKEAVNEAWDEAKSSRQ